MHHCERNSSWTNRAKYCHGFILNRLMGSWKEQRAIVCSVHLFVKHASWQWWPCNGQTMKNTSSDLILKTKLTTSKIPKWLAFKCNNIQPTTSQFIKNCDSTQSKWMKSFNWLSFFLDDCYKTKQLPTSLTNYVVDATTMKINLQLTKWKEQIFTKSENDTTNNISMNHPHELVVIMLSLLVHPPVQTWNHNIYHYHIDQMC